MSELINRFFLFLASKRFLKRRLDIILPEVAHIDFKDAKIRMHLSLKDMRGPSYHLLHRPRRFMDYENQNRSKMLEIARTLPKNAIFLDIGSNIGLFSTLIAKNLPDSTVFAFDPDPICYLTLTRTKIANKIENLHILPIGLSNQNKILDFHFDPLNHGGHSFDRSSIHSKAEPVRSSLATFRLDQLIGSLGLNEVHLMKIDVQGVEWQVLNGAEHLLQKNRPVLMVECEYQHLLSAGESIAKLFPNYECESSFDGSRFDAHDLPARAADEMKKNKKHFSDFWFFPRPN